MEEKRITSVRELLEQMSTEQLDTLLEQELHREQIQDDVVRMILCILREREKDVPVQLTPKMESAWEKYESDLLKAQRVQERKVRGRRLAVRAAAAAAVLAVVLTVIPHQAGAERLWDRLARWTSGFVDFFGTEDNGHRIAVSEFETDHPGLQQVYDIAVQQGVTGPAVPAWLPEEYELAELTVRSTPVKDIIYSRFVNGDSEIVLEIEKYHVEISRKYQKDDGVAEIYEYNGVMHYLMRNVEKLVAVWTTDQTECSISVDCQEDVLKKILKTIYVVEAE